MTLLKACRIVLAGVFLFVGSTVRPLAAQDPTPPPPPPPPTATRQPPNPDTVVDMMGAKLNLSDAQKAQIRPIVAERQQKMATLRSDTSMRPMQKARKLKGIVGDSDKKIEAALTEPQKQQYIQMEQQMREQMKERRENGRGGAGAGVPQ